jgi:hypothetical protein
MAAASTSVAQAQTTTTAPCGSGTPNACGFNVDVNLGNMREGDSNTPGNPGYQGGTTCSVTVNGQAADPVTANANGQCPVPISVTSDGIPNNALGARLPLAVIGLNHLLAQTTAPQIKVGNRTFTANALGTQNLVVVKGAVPGPAANQGQYNIRFTVVGPAGASTGAGGLSRTGIMVVRWSLLGASLIAVGVLFIMASRRRRQTTAS